MSGRQAVIDKVNFSRVRQGGLPQSQNAVIVAHAANISAAVHLQQHPVALFLLRRHPFQGNAVNRNGFHLPSGRRFEGSRSLHGTDILEIGFHIIRCVLFFRLSLQHDSVRGNRQRLRLRPNGRRVHK